MALKRPSGSEGGGSDRRHKLLVVAAGLFLVVWGFVLGVLVGRGSLPTIVDQEKPKAVVEESAKPGQIKEELQKRASAEAPPPPAPAPTLDFYKDLDKKRRPVVIAPPPTTPPPPPEAAPQEPQRQPPAKEPVATSPPAPPKPEPPKPGPSEKVRAKYTIQVAAFKNKDSAEKFALESSQRTGLSFKVVTATIAGKGTWHRVQVGAFATRSEALAQLKALKDQGIKDALVARAGP